MDKEFDPEQNYKKTKKIVGYIPRLEADDRVYKNLGFKCGLEIHQQLNTAKKLFCRCPAGIYQRGEDYDAELIRHMRPTLSELGEYDGTALMEFKTRKDIIYRIKDETACTYDIDDTPPFPINREALDIALEVALLLKTNIVGELHITRKQYLDGSIPTGFQRTTIVGIEGEIPISKKMIRIKQISLEEDSCREVSDCGHQRIYTTDRLGIPLLEPVTYPDMLTPDEAAEAGHYLRFLIRSTGKSRTGIGAGRQDVNVSIDGGQRVEIKGVAHIRWIPELTHNEAFRQKGLLEIKKILKDRVADQDSWSLKTKTFNPAEFGIHRGPLYDLYSQNDCLLAVNLPKFKGLLSFFLQPGKSFADELSGRLQVIACLNQPNLTSSEDLGFNTPGFNIDFDTWELIRRSLGSQSEDAQVIIRGPEEDMKTAIETIEERCRFAFDGVPNETRKSFPDGTTIFERVLPGADRMYPDTDSAPIPIEDEQIEIIRDRLPLSVSERVNQLRNWKIPEDTYHYLLGHNLVWIIQKVIEDFDQDPKFVGTLFGHTLRHLETRINPATSFRNYTLYGLFKFICNQQLEKTIAGVMLPELYAHPQMVFESVLTAIGYKQFNRQQIYSQVSFLKNKFAEIRISPKAEAESDWIMGQLRPMAIGNISMSDLRQYIDSGAGK